MNELRMKLEESISGGFREEALIKIKRQLKEVFTEAEDDFECWIKADIPHNLAAFVERMAADAIESMLRGDEQEMRRRLHCQEGAWTGRDHEHCVIRGKLYETGAIELRKQIVDAFPDLLRAERILDLESQLAAMVRRVAVLEKQLDDLRIGERYGAL